MHLSLTPLETYADTITITAKLFRGFADPSRLSIVTALCEEPRFVGELVERTGLSQPNVSNHLRCLSDCGLVVSERNGRHIRYMISDARVLSLLLLTEELLADVAAGIDACPNYSEPEDV